MASTGGASWSGIRGWTSGDHERVRAWGSEPRPAVTQVSDPPVHGRQQTTRGVRGPTETFHFSRNKVRTECAQLQSSLTVTSTKHRCCRFITISFLRPSSSRLPICFHISGQRGFLSFSKLLFFKEMAGTGRTHKSPCPVIYVPEFRYHVPEFNVRNRCPFTDPPSFSFPRYRFGSIPTASLGKPASLQKRSRTSP